MDAMPAACSARSRPGSSSQRQRLSQVQPVQQEQSEAAVSSLGTPASGPSLSRGMALTH